MPDALGLMLGLMSVLMLGLMLVLMSVLMLGSDPGIVNGGADAMPNAGLNAGHRESISAYRANHRYPIEDQ